MKEEHFSTREIYTENLAKIVRKVRNHPGSKINIKLIIKE